MAHRGHRRILFVSWGAHLGGVESSIHARMKALRKLGIECEKLFLRPGAGLDTFSDFTVHVTCDPPALASIITTGRYDAVSLVNFACRKVVLQARYPGTLVYEIRGRGAMLARCSALSPGEARAVLVPSRYVAGLVEEALGPVSIPVRVVPNAVDTGLFRPLDLPGGTDLPVPASPGRPVVLWVGRLEPNKNWTEMLEAARVLLETGGDVEFWVVADVTVSPDAGSFSAELERRGLKSRVRLFPCVPHRNMPVFFNLARSSGGCTLSTSRSEGLQNSLLEAMACACPVVSSDVGGNREIITDGVNGWLYPPGDPGAAAARVRMLLEDPRRRQQLAWDGLLRVRRGHSPGAHAARFLNTLEGCP